MPSPSGEHGRFQSFALPASLTPTTLCCSVSAFGQSVGVWENNLPLAPVRVER